MEPVKMRGPGRAIRRGPGRAAMRGPERAAMRGLAAAVACAATLLCSCVTDMLGTARTAFQILPEGNFEISDRPDGGPASGEPLQAFRDAACARAVVESWAARKLPDWYAEGKVNATRILMARLAAGSGLEEVNAYLNAATPWGESGSTWALHAEGDYDFTLAPLVAVLYLFGGDAAVLHADTAAHIVDVLLTEYGGAPRLTVPVTLGLVGETENHILMTEGSRYLANQWKRRSGDADPHYDNAGNGLESWLVDHLRGIEAGGFFEFNSNPYQGYTITALLNLEAFADSAEIRLQARRLLDVAAWQYAFGSLSFRRYPPYRRQPERAGVTALNADPQTALMMAWYSLARPEWQGGTPPAASHQFLYAALLPYRLPEGVLALLEGSAGPSFVRFGRGPGASPELYGRWNGTLLSAGGTGRGPLSHVVARPVVLFLDDGAKDLSRVFRIPGPGHWSGWNATGVLPRFAVGGAAALAPQGAAAEAARDDGAGGTWSVYRAPGAEGGILVAAYAAPDLGILALFGEEEWTSAAALTDALAAANPDPESLRRCFTWPSAAGAASTAAPGPFRAVSYDPHAPAGTWVIAEVDGVRLDRAMDAWPRMEDLSASLR